LDLGVPHLDLGAPHLDLGAPSQKPPARTFFLGASHLKREAPPNFGRRVWMAK